MHIPVLQKEIIQYLDPKPNDNFIDCTVNGGGHALAILENTEPKGRVLGIDWSNELIQETKKQFQQVKNRLVLVNDNFTNLIEIVNKEKFFSPSGILFDLGMSSWHLEESEKGFSFQKNEPLDMRYSSLNPKTAEKILNFWSETEIEKILKEYGEERLARPIAKGIIETRKLGPIKTTLQLVKIIERVVPIKYSRNIHPATKTFQALRIAVNDELDNIEKVLPKAIEALKPGGRLVVISFHSLEDRIVKNYFKEKSRENVLRILTKKPIVASLKEIRINPRSRSAKLRAVIKINK